MKNFNKKLCFLALLAVAIMSFICTTNNYAQEEREDNPRTWKYFRILARAQDDSIFIMMQIKILRQMLSRN